MQLIQSIEISLAVHIYIQGVGSVFCVDKNNVQNVCMKTFAK